MQQMMLLISLLIDFIIQPAYARQKFRRCYDIFTDAMPANCRFRHDWLFRHYYSHDRERMLRHFHDASRYFFFFFAWFRVYALFILLIRRHCLSFSSLWCHFPPAHVFLAMPEPLFSQIFIFDIIHGAAISDWYFTIVERYFITPLQPLFSIAAAYAIRRIASVDTAFRPLLAFRSPCAITFFFFRQACWCHAIFFDGIIAAMPPMLLRHFLSH